MEQRMPSLYKHIYHTYGRYFGGWTPHENPSCQHVLSCKNNSDKTGSTESISAVSNNTHTVKQALRMWSKLGSYEAFNAS